MLCLADSNTHKVEGCGSVLTKKVPHEHEQLTGLFV